MEKLITFNNQVKAFLGVDIHYNLAIYNFKINGYWVTDVNHFHFAQFEKNFKKLIDKNIDRDSEKEVVFLKNIQDDLKKNHSFLNDIDYDKIQDFCSSVDLKYPEKPPVHNIRDLAEVTPWDNEGRADYIFQILLSYLKEDDEEDDELMGKEWDEMDILLEEKGLVVDKLYGKAHLMIIVSYQLELIQKVIDYIQSYFDTLAKMGTNYWDDDDDEKEKKDKYEEKPQNQNLHSIYFNLIKKDVAIFFHTLHELDIITANENDWSDSQEKMKKWIDNSNIYFKPKNGRKAIVKDIKRYFSSLNTKDWDKDEIDFLEKTFIPKLKTRLQELKERVKK